MSGRLDARHIRRAFTRAARSYDSHAVLQVEVGSRLRERLDVLEQAPRRILDVGAGTGEGSVALRERYPDAELLALDIALPMLGAARSRDSSVQCVAGDAHALPLADGSVDLLHANLVMQWCDDPPRVLREFRRVLVPGGLMLFTTFGPDTLMELRMAFAEVDEQPHVSRFADMHDIGDALIAQGFRDPVLGRDMLQMTYADVPALMRDLRAIGATNADSGRRRTLTGRGRIARLAEAYEGFRNDDGRLPATYEVIYAHALAPPDGQPVREADRDIASFSIDQLRGSRARRK